jgi:hypothetical protein
MKDLWDTIRTPNLWIIEGEDLEAKGIENLFNNIIAENFSNLMKGRTS